MSKTLIEKNENAIDAVVEGEIVTTPATKIEKPTEAERRRAWRVHLLLPMLFLTVALFGGMRFSAIEGSFIFLKPPLVCLIFAAMLILLFVRAGLIRIGHWFSEELPMLSNIANGIVLFSLFAASTQVFNSLIPEQGIPYRIVAFCFFWTLWNNIFAEFDTRRLMRSLGALFALAFVAKYLVLLNLAVPANQTWVESVFQSPSKTAATWLLDIPQFSAATGYLQFFVLAGFMLGLYLFPSAPKPANERSTALLQL